MQLWHDFTDFPRPTIRMLPLDQLWHYVAPLCLNCRDGFLHFHPQELPRSVNSAESLLNKFEGVTFDDGEMMVSFDTNSLFASIPQRFAEDIVNQLLTENHGLDLHGLTVEDIIRLLRLCLRSWIYEQNKINPMHLQFTGQSGNWCCRNLKC